MDVSSIVSISTSMAAEKTSVAAHVSVLKKAINLQELATMCLIDAIPTIPTLPANPNIGRNINTTA